MMDGFGFRPAETLRNHRLPPLERSRSVGQAHRHSDMRDGHEYTSWNRYGRSAEMCQSCRVPE